jgi:hypothetical protein
MNTIIPVTILLRDNCINEESLEKVYSSPLLTKVNRDLGARHGIVFAECERESLDELRAIPEVLEVEMTAMKSTRE